MKFFNTVGPINPNDHYFLPHRLDWEQLNMFIERKYYFLLHAPRQSGKTTAIKEYVNYLNNLGTYKAIYFSCERAREFSHDPIKTNTQLLKQIRRFLEDFFPEDAVLTELNLLFEKHSIDDDSFLDFLRLWSKISEKPIILFMDEFDGIEGNSLVSLLTQIRVGYSDRPERFPQSICLIGVRDLRDYKIKTEKEIELGILYSPFNIKAESLRLKDFSLEDVKNLYYQHTQETGQQFTEDAIDYAYYLTQGQPWLVNALAYQACFRDVLDRTIPITKEIIEKAKEQLILRRDTHIDGLVDRLKEPRVRNIIDIILSGKSDIGIISEEDRLYLYDLGLIKQKELEISNPIYQEIIPRALTADIYGAILEKPAWYVVDNKLDTHKLFMRFTQFFRENSGSLQKQIAYHESTPQLILMAFLERVINGGGTIHREYAVGKQRIDLLVIWKEQRIVIETKIQYGSITLTKGLVQTAKYMDLCNAIEGHLVIFDRDTDKNWEEKISQATETVHGKIVYVWQM